MKLRWLVRKYPKPTKGEVKELYNEGCMPLSRCYSVLKKPDEKVLQVFIPDEFWCNIDNAGTWVDVPIVEEMVDD